MLGCRPHPVRERFGRPKNVTIEGNHIEGLNDGRVYDVFAGADKGRSSAPYPGSAVGIDAGGGTTADASEATVRDNNLLAPNGAENKDDKTLVAECNWWGAPSGPFDQNNPNGWGSIFLGDVDSEPWLVVPAPTPYNACVSLLQDLDDVKIDGVPFFDVFFNLKCTLRERARDLRHQADEPKEREEVVKAFDKCKEELRKARDKCDEEVAKSHEKCLKELQKCQEELRKAEEKCREERRKAEETCEKEGDDSEKCQEERQKAEEKCQEERQKAREECEEAVKKCQEEITKAQQKCQEELEKAQEKCNEELDKAAEKID